MKRSKRLNVVLSLYQQREDSAAEQVQVVQNQLRDQEVQLAQLVAYQEDYQHSVKAKDGHHVAVSMAQWRRLQNYIEQLDGIIKQQEQHVNLLTADLERAEAVWHNLHLDRRSMETAIEAIVRDEQLTASRQEQKQLDEMIQQQRQRKIR
ncbi:MAG: flagellar export protein FliJ [Natronospirillum sp.]